MGGVSFPLLSDFEPKGGLAKALGLYLDGPGIGDRATVIIDREGIVRYANSAGPGGRRDIGELAAECEKVGGAQLADPGSISAGSKLYIKSACGPSRAAALAVDNLHQGNSLVTCNVSEDAAAKDALVAAGGQDQTPCLVVDGKAQYESADIVSSLVQAIAPLP